MKRALLFVLVAALLQPATAGANGRRPTSTDVHFHPDDDNWILFAVTFGFLLSTDHGESFRWVCEEAACPGEMGFNGCDTFDPVYQITADGDIFNTTIFGLHVSRDGGCSFDPVGGPLEGRFAGDLEIDVDGNIWTVTSDGAFPNDVYFSNDDGQTFTQRNLHLDAGWFDTVRTAPSNTQRVYVSGWVPGQDDGMGGFTDPETLLYRSDDRGATWDQITPAGIPAEAKLYLDVVSLSDEDVLFARVPNFTGADAMEDIYRSTNGGDTWTNVLSLSIETVNMTDPLGLVRVAALANGNYLAGSPLGGLRRSTDGGATWTPTAVEPMTWCVRQAGDGIVYACSENWDPDMLLDPSVRAALADSSDEGASWAHTFRFADLAGPHECPAGTVQRDVCGPGTERWCTLAGMFGISDPACGDVTPDAGPNGSDGGNDPPDDDTCGCSTTAAASMFLVIPPLFGRRRRYRFTFRP